MKTILLFGFIAFSSALFGKGIFFVLPEKTDWLNQSADCNFPGGKLEGNSLTEIFQNAERYLKNYLPDLKSENAGLMLTDIKQSPYATYLNYVQTFQGYEIYGTSVKISIDKNYNIQSIVSKTASVNNWLKSAEIQNPDESVLKSAIGFCDNYTYKIGWFYDGDIPVPSYSVTCNNNNGSRSENLVLNLSYEILYRKSLIKNYKYPDSLATMYVFYPDPLTSAQVTYGEPYANHNDSDVAVLDAQMEPHDAKVSVVNDSFFLENKYLKVTDLASPHSAPTYSKNNTFHFRRDTSAFRDIMIYYHLNNWRLHLKELGYDSLGYTQVLVDAQGRYDDESNFQEPVGGSSPNIFFGIGGIPDAEDADVPYHEFTHYLSYSACQGCSDYGFEREALDEGTADYFAASFSKSMNTYNWQRVFKWDGNYQNWTGRSCSVGDHYPEALKTGDKYNLGQLWSSSLMQIWDVIGRNKTDAIMLETLYSLGKNLTMTDAAKLYIKSDSLIYQGADVKTIAHYFIQRGFLPVGYVGIQPINQQIGYKVITSYFSSANKVIIDFEEPQSGIFTLYDITGKEIASNRISHAVNTEFMAPGLASGIYILNVNTDGLQKSFKLLK